MAAGDSEFGLNVDILGITLVHPYFWGCEPIGSEALQPEAKARSKRVLVCVAEKDVLRDRGRLYYVALGRSGWMGVVKIMETEGEGHGFHLIDLESHKAKDLINRLAAFYNRDKPHFL
ncbi:26S proteasome non-ATPase regulatory subunit 14-like protein [Hibiscus syriacus]|uniref:26S proteasome non-ATPase regulatory subunit 14-like protein n=1 Tax=Hibiscus syriacus TaxID=106335 RepID=A0A6A3BH32_HIBSY|nr:26S proteasome non-ATPase regulatory subunit 14-like protein [Hibiscus syriacus]